MATTSSSRADYDYLFKLSLIGDSGVGKSCLNLRFSEGSFTTSFTPTAGMDFKTRTIELNGKRIKLEICDTAGQERYLEVTEAYYGEAMGALFVYAVTDETSFLNINKWMNNFNKFASDDKQKILVGNKADVEESKRVVSRSRGQELADKYGMKFYETSAKSNLCVEEVFFAISKDILQSKMKEVHEQRLKREKALKSPLHYDESSEAFGLDDEAPALLAKLAAVHEGRNEIVEKDGIPILVDIVASGSEKGKENTVDENTIGYSNRNFFWPPSNLLDGNNRSLYLSIGVPLYHASLNGDWESAKKLIDENYSIGARNLLCCSITNRYETALHVAAGARQAAFVEELLKLLESTDLTLQDRMGNTAFCLAAAAGAVPITKKMMEKNPDLLYTPSTANITPLYIAANFGHRNMAWFLYHQTIDRIQNLEGIFFRCIDTGLFDLALELWRKDEFLAVARNEYDETALHLLARKPSIFSSKNSSTVRALKRHLHLLARKLSIFSSENCGTLKRLKRLVIKSIKNAGFWCEDHTGKMPNNSLELVRCIFKHILKEPSLDIEKLINHPTRLLFEAARMGNYIFLAELIRMYPELIWEVNDENQTIFHIAVLNRHINIFNQIHKIGSIKDEIVTYESNLGDNILHLAATIPSSDRLKIVSGAALQMHQELLWFKEVKRITPFLLREKIGSGGLTPRELFIKEHKDLLSDGEKWMKNTARSCMIVATLITTVVFASAFSIPGGNNDTGTPIQIKKTLFHVFAISDAMALSSSIISTLMFLYILTSRYAEEDFLESLPFKLMVGLATLFISMIAMMVAFMAAFFLAYHHRKLSWVPFLSSSFLFVPVSLFVMLLSPLFRDIFHAACWGSPFRSGGSETMIPQERVNRPQEKYSDYFEHQQMFRLYNL